MRAFVDAAVQAGHPDNDDYNAGDSRGASFARATIRGGHRATAWRSYVRPVAGSPLLRVVTDALVTRVVVDGDRAVGGEYVRDGERRTIRAEKEVVLSAGVFGTPQLLMPSGIGAADELRPHGIDVVRDLPGVGRNLRDHVASPLVWASRLDVPAPRMTGIEAQLIADSGDAGDDPARPAGGLRLLRLLHAHRRPAGAGVHRARDPAAPGEPRSGAAALRRPTETPLIDPAIPSDPRDLDALVDHLESLRQVGAHPRRPSGSSRRCTPARTGRAATRSATTCGRRPTAGTTRWARRASAPTSWRSSSCSCASTA